MKPLEIAAITTLLASSVVALQTVPIHAAAEQAAPQSSPAAPAAPPPQPPPAPAQSARPMVPLAPKDPAELSTLNSALAEQRKTQEEQRTYFEEGNRHLQADNAKIQAFEDIAQSQITEIKKKEGWGPEVQFNRATGKFERPLPGGKAAESKSAPIYKDTKPDQPAGKKEPKP